MVVGMALVDTLFCLFFASSISPLPHTRLWTWMRAILLLPLRILYISDHRGRLRERRRWYVFLALLPQCTACHCTRPEFLISLVL